MMSTQLSNNATSLMKDAKEEEAEPRYQHWPSKLIVTQRVPDLAKASKRRTELTTVEAWHTMVTAGISLILLDKQAPNKTDQLLVMPHETLAEEKQRLAAAASSPKAFGTAISISRAKASGDLPEPALWTWTRVCRMCLPGRGKGFDNRGVPLLVMAGAPFVFRPRTGEAKGCGTFSSFAIAKLGYDDYAHERLLSRRPGVEGLSVMMEKQKTSPKPSKA